MSFFAEFISGFNVILQPGNFFYCFMGVFIGTLIGVLPGIGPWEPCPYSFLPPSACLLFLRSSCLRESITVRCTAGQPPPSSSISRGKRLRWSPVWTATRWPAGKSGTCPGDFGLRVFYRRHLQHLIALMFLVFPLARAALKFGPPEYFSLVCMSMTVLIYLAKGSVLNAIIMVLVGVFLSTVGVDLFSGAPRFTFGSIILSDGSVWSLWPWASSGYRKSLQIFKVPSERIIFKTKIKNLLPNKRDWKDSAGAIARGSVIGFFLGILPGAGALISSFLSYTVEKKLSKHPEEFGKGAIEGVAGPETANNAATGGAFVPLLAIGIPPNVVMAILLGALMIHGIVPGPILITQHPEIFWGTIASMYIGNIMLLLLNLPLIGLWVKVLRCPTGF